MKNGITTLMTMALVATAASASAQSLSDWNGRVGVGVGTGAAFPGSNKSDTQWMPLINAETKDGKLFINNRHGVGYNVINDGKIKAGASVGYVRGRDSGDDFRLNGFKDIDGTAGAKVFGEYAITDHVSLTGEVQQELWGAKGTTATVGAQTMVPVEDKLRLRAGVDTTWATRNHMQKWYGVNAAQSAASGMGQFNAESGMRDISARAGADFDLTDRITLTGGARLGYLLGDAKDSPISKRNWVPGVFAGVSYAF